MTYSRIYCSLKFSFYIFLNYVNIIRYILFLLTRVAVTRQDVCHLIALPIFASDQESNKTAYIRKISEHVF